MIPLGELVGAMSLATDLGTGLPLEHGLRTCLLATRLAEAAQCDEAVRGDAWVVALRQLIGQLLADALDGDLAQRQAQRRVGAVRAVDDGLGRLARIAGLAAVQGGETPRARVRRWAPGADGARGRGRERPAPQRRALRRRSGARVFDVIEAPGQVLIAYGAEEGSAAARRLQRLAQLARPTSSIAA